MVSDLVGRKEEREIVKIDVLKVIYTVFPRLGVLLE
jgi:hypothetical protein